MSSDVRAGAHSPLVTSDHVAVRPFRLESRTALLSIDVETDYGTGRVDAFEGTGPLVGVHGDRALVHGACAGLPCPIEEIDLRTGRRSVLVEEAGLASVDGSGAGSLVFETAAGQLAVLDLGSGRRSHVTADAGLLPVRQTSAATSGAETPGGAVLVAPRGRVGQPSAAQHVDPATHAAVSLGEVLK